MPPLPQTPLQPPTDTRPLNTQQPIINMPTPKQQSWGVVISIVIIVLMIIIGAFYAWGQRIAQNQVFPASATAK